MDKYEIQSMLDVVQDAWRKVYNNPQIHDKPLAALMAVIEIAKDEANAHELRPEAIEILMDWAMGLA